MRKYSHLPAIAFLVWLLTQLILIPKVLAAPGDFLFLWGSQQHFADPSGVAAEANGNVFVTDVDKVHVFNSSGILVRKWGSYGSGDGQLSYPGGIAVDGTGRIYVADTGNDRVQIFNSSGEFLGKWTHPDWATRPPVTIASDGRGKVYVAESGAGGTVKIFDSAGNFLKQLSPPPYEYSEPFGVAVDADGNVYVVEGNGVQVYNAAGEFVKMAVEGYFTSVAVDQSRNIHVVNGARWVWWVEIYDSAGGLIRRLGSDDGGHLTGEHFWIASAVAVDGKGTVYALDADNDGLSAFDSAGKQLPDWWTYGAFPGQLSRPQGLAVDSSGKVYETDGYDNRTHIWNNRVQIFSGDGKSLGLWNVDVPQTSGITVDDSGNVYVLQRINLNTMTMREPGSEGYIYDASGNFLRELGHLIPCSFENGQCSYPYGIAIDKTGNAVVTGAFPAPVSVYDSAGNYLRNIESPDGFANAKGVAVDQQGNIYVADSNNSRVQVFDSAYNFIRKWGSQGSGDGQFSSPAGIAVDKGGHVFVADGGNNRIQVFNSSGLFLKKWGGEGDDNGLFRGPEGIAVDKSGMKVYVADTGNNRIQVFEGYGSAGPFTLSGTVRQGSDIGAVLPAATVSIAGKTAITSSTGTFSITGIPAGTYTLTISRTGYVTKTIAGYEITSDSSGLVFSLTRVAYSLSGTVRNGSVNGPALSGATVSIAGRRATTASDGTFTVTAIPSGTYTLYLSRYGYVSKSVTGYAVNSDKSGVVYYLTPATYSISGTVRQGSSSGPVLAGATVSLAGKSAVTGSTGTFTLTGIPAGSYTLTISRTGYATKSVTGYVVNSNKSGVVFYLTPATYSISGTVRQGSASGPVLAGATVAIAGKTAITSSTGTFSITGIPAGSYTLTISRTGYVTKTVTGYAVNSNKSGVVFYLARASAGRAAGAVARPTKAEMSRRPVS